VLIVYQQTGLADEDRAPERHSEQSAAQPWQVWAEKYPDWVAPMAPFRVIGNIYYVGTVGLASYLLTSDDGHILLDGGLPQNATIIAANIETLGFSLGDVKLLLNSHAHFDHSGGLAELKELTNARLLASAADRPELESGRYAGSDDLSLSAPPVSVDRVFNDQEVVSLGNIKLTANLTPGHSPGCTSWTTRVATAVQNLQVLFFCSASVAANRLVDPPQYPGIVDDYRHTFAITRDWRPDVFLANHPFTFSMLEKINRRSTGDQNAFIDRDEFPRYIRQLEADFKRILAEQTAAAGKAE
jgi:metallo-beta-lactamase class B